MFLLPDDEADAPGRRLAEINVMIADARSRRGGLGSEAVSMMLLYGVSALGLTAFVAKINVGNGPSIALFQKLGFVETARVEAFGEVHLTLELPDAAARRAFLDRHAYVVTGRYEGCSDAPPAGGGVAPPS